MSQRYDIAIIGGGIAGLSVAYFLSRHTANIALLEQEAQPGYHTSGRSAAMYIEGYENPVVADFTRAGRSFFFSPPAGFTDYELLTPRGGLTVAGPGEEAALANYCTTWQPFCPELRAISAAECLDHVPGLRQDWLRAGAYDPELYTIDVHGLMSGFQQGFKRAGGALHTNARVTGLVRTTQGWRVEFANKAERAELHAGIVVNAAGAWADQIAALAGLTAIDLTPMRRTAAIVPAPPDSLSWPLVHTISASLYFKPESPGLMLSPQDETPVAAMDAYADDMDVAIAIDRLGSILNHDVKTVIRQWAGLRTFAPDRHPVVGFDPRASGFFWLAGQGGFGVQTSPGLGLHAAACVMGEPVASAIDVKRWL
jgi:D-arginine dehydrogenase